MNIKIYVTFIILYLCCFLGLKMNLLHTNSEVTVLVKNVMVTRGEEKKKNRVYGF
jgi:hypothetical protein